MSDARRVTFDNEDLNELQEELHLACEKGTIEEIRNFFNKHKLEDLYYEGFSPLHTAVVSGRSDLVQVIDLLVENGVDVNAPTETSKDTALHLAVENGNFPQNYDVIVKLVNLNADPDIRNKRLRTPYDCALAKGHDLIAATLDGSKSSTEVQNTYRERYGEKHAPDLNRAVLESDEEAIKTYIKKGADPNYINRYGAGAIHYAVSRCTLPVLHVLDMLIAAGADVDLRDDEGDSALNLAIKNEELRREKQMMPVVNLLLEAAADITFQDLDGKDALQLAKERHYDDVVDALSKNRVAQLRVQEPEPEPEDEIQEPKTESEDKVQEPESQPEDDRVVMDSLEDTRENDGDVNTPNNINSVNDDANDDQEKENTEDPDSREDVTEDGLYPIHQAILKEDPEERLTLLETLVEAGADVNIAVRGLGTTALHLAADRGQADSVKFLLDHGADKTKKTVVGKTAFNMASDKEHREVMELLGDREDIVQERWRRGRKKSSTCNIL